MHLREQVTQPSDPSYRIIPLTQGQVTLVDAEDYEWLMKWSWYAAWMKCTQSFYAARTTPRDPLTGKQRRIFMARAIVNAPSGVLVDHRDNDTLNNRRCNLRISDRSQNGWNRRKLSAGHSRFKGVSRNHKGIWIASIRIKGRPIHLGRFAAEVDAVAAYNAAAVKYFGEFAKPSEIPGDNV